MASNSLRRGQPSFSLLLFPTSPCTAAHPPSGRVRLKRKLLFAGDERDTVLFSLRKSRFRHARRAWKFADGCALAHGIFTCLPLVGTQGFSCRIEVRIENLLPAFWFDGDVRPTGRSGSDQPVADSFGWGVVCYLFLTFWVIS